jgi:hypothetical protein
MHDEDDHRRASEEKQSRNRPRILGAGVFHPESPF